MLDAGSNSVGSLAFVVPPVASTNVQVRFAPEFPGATNGLVVFLSNGGDSTNAVSGLGFGTPVIIELAKSPTEFLFSFETVAGKNYEVQYKDLIDAAVWQTLQVVPGDGTLKTVTNLTVAPAQRFYRLLVQ